MGRESVEARARQALQEAMYRSRTFRASWKTRPVRSFDLATEAQRTGRWLLATSAGEFADVLPELPLAMIDSIVVTLPPGVQTNESRNVRCAASRSSGAMPRSHSNSAGPRRAATVS